MRKIRFLKHLSLICLPLLAGGGCSSIFDAHSQKKEIMALYDSGNIPPAIIQVADKAESRSDTGDALMWHLEEGAMRFDEGEYGKSLTALNSAENKINEYDQRATVSFRDVGAEAGAAATNLNALPYKGFYYDRILLNCYKALDYFAMNKPEDALVELRRMRYTQKQIVQLFAKDIDREKKEIAKEKAEAQKSAAQLPNSNGNIETATIISNPVVSAALKEAREKSEKTYGNLVNPFATYMSALGYLYDNNISEAIVDFRNLYAMNKENPLTNRDYVTLARQMSEPLPAALKEVKPYTYKQTPSQVLAVKKAGPIAPAKPQDQLYNYVQEVQPYNYSLSNNIIYVIFANGRGPALKQTKFQIILPWVGYTGIAFPQYEYYPATYTSLRIMANGAEYRSVVVADMDNVASQEYVNRLPLMVTRIVINYLTKEVASLVATQAAQQQGTGALIAAYAVTGVYKYLFNTADTRCWETLPKQYQIAHLPIPPDRRIIITPLAGTMTEQSTAFQLKNDTRFAIVYIRAGTSKIYSQKLLEFK